MVTNSNNVIVHNVNVKKKIQNIKNAIVKMNLLFLNFLSFFKKNLTKELSTNLEGSLNPERMTPKVETVRSDTKK